MTPAEPAWLDVLRRAADEGIGQHLVPGDAVAELARHCGGVDAARLIVTLCTLGKFGNTAYRDRERRAVARRLRRIGVPSRPGRRAAESMEDLVRGVASIALAHGVPLASGDGSKLVHALRLTAEMFGVEGDPRSVLRRLLRAHRVEFTEFTKVTG